MKKRILGIAFSNLHDDFLRADGRVCGKRGGRLGRHGGHELVYECT